MTEIIYFHTSSTSGTFMKKIYLLLFLFSKVLPAFNQAGAKTGEAFYMLDENFKGTTQQKANYFSHAEKIGDSCWQYDIYNINGPIISSEQYKDEKGQLAEGAFYYYNKKGTIDSTGSYKNGFQQGTWYFINEKGIYILQKEYESGDLISTKDLTKKNDSTDKKKEKKSVRDEKESVFPGGVQAWTTYLSSNMVYPQRAQNLVKQGTVVIQFIVDKKGYVISPAISQSIEFSIDQEALRLIKQSPVWTPAMQDGKIVKSYKKQPITFRLE